MRSFLAGLCVLLLPTVAFAQARGEVESIGFGGVYRPGCWTPMVIRLTPTTTANFSGRLEVVQEDLDRDKIIFTRNIALTGNPASGGTREPSRYWMYFMPQPTRQANLAIDASKSPAELSKIITVRLCTDSGKELIKIPITQQLMPVESPGTGGNVKGRGTRFVLGIQNNSTPNFVDYQQVLGITENVEFYSTKDLSFGVPEHVIGYDGIDAIVWTDADPTKLSAAQASALTEFVKRGGRLVICQDTTPTQWQRNNLTESMLLTMMPVAVRGLEQKDHVNILRDLALPYSLRQTPAQLAQMTPAQIEQQIRLDRVNRYGTAVAAWDQLQGPFSYAVAEPRPGANVLMWFDDKPWLVRMPMGAGNVTWVAQDLGSPQLKGSRDLVSAVGWSRIWDEVIDWPNESTHMPSNRPRDGPYDARVSIELGRATLAFMDLKSTSAALIGIAVLFFIVYWVAAGPGSFLVLSRKNRSHYSWIAFATMALAATGLTWIITKLVLRGDPKMQHVTVVRHAAGEPAVIQTGFGLYIPRDGDQTIEIKDGAAGRSSYISPFNIHPAFNVGDIDFPASQDYYMSVLRVQEAGKEDAGEPTKITVPYRSTLKKFQAVWTGEFSKGISGDARLTDNSPFIAGTLTNNTGAGLRSVYIAFVHPAIDAGDRFISQEYIFYISYWDKDTSIKLEDFTTAKGAKAIKADEMLVDSSDHKVVKRYFGRITPDRQPSAASEQAITPEINSWTDYFYTSMRYAAKGSFGDQSLEEAEPITPKLFPILSFYGRLPVSRNVVKNNTIEALRQDRFDLLRRGNRHLDMSSAISAGQLAVIAVSENDQQRLPFPMEVDGDRIDNTDRCNGIVYYQFVLPIDRKAYNKPPATQPATKPSTQPSTKPVTPAPR